MDVPGLFQEKNTKQEWIPERLLQHLPAGSRRAGGSEELREVLVVPAPPVGRPGGPYEVTWGVCPLLIHLSSVPARIPHGALVGAAVAGRAELQRHRLGAGFVPCDLLLGCPPPVSVTVVLAFFLPTALLPRDVFVCPLVESQWK